jgi:hypothetical protein
MPTPFLSVAVRAFRDLIMYVNTLFKERTPKSIIDSNANGSFEYTNITCDLI